MSYHTGSNNNRSSQPSSTPPASTPPVTPQPSSTPASTPPVTRQQTYVSPTARSTPEQRSGGSNNREGVDGGNNRGENGPFSVGGYCPLYTTARAAVAASPYPDMMRIGEKSKGFHVHVIDGGRYYMPNGLVMGETQFHGDCPGLIPAPEFDDDGTVINPEGYVPSVIIAGGKIRFPMMPSLIQTGSKEEMWYMTQRQEWRDECKQGSPPEYCYGDTAEEREGQGMEFWKAETDEEWREWVRDHLSKESFFSNNDPIYAAYVDYPDCPPDCAYEYGIQTWIERFGEDPIAVRNTYLNENTTGWILLDWESPVNFGNLLNTSQSDLRAFVEGVIRRINILREFMPNAKFGLWRFGDGRNPRYRGSEVNQFLRRQVFASGIKYQGKTLFDALDFLSPTLYQYAYFEYNEPIALSRILNGERVQRSKDTCDSIFEEHGEVKPVVPIIHNTYLLNNTEYAGADADDAALPGDDLAYQLNALEIEYWEEYPSHFAYWYARTEDLYDHYYHRDLLLRYYDETYRAPYQGGDKGNQGTPVPIDPNYSLETGLETETIGEPPEERRLENDNSNNSQRNTYENGKRIPGNFPTAYQNSINQAVPDGQKCGNCKLFSQKSGYCSAWKATANKNYWCQSYVPRVNITMNGAAVSSSGEMFSVRDSNKKLITYRKGSTVLYNGELYEVTKNVFGQLPDKSSSFVKITNIDDNVIDGGSFGETSSVTRTPVRRSSSGSSSSSSGGGY